MRRLLWASTNRDKTPTPATATPVATTTPEEWSAEDRYHQSNQFGR